ncbi:ESPR-type extended signal peptide-containing protein, partial [Pyramidobacter sp.]|uniref:ESPR-type extended signal peptide-containing protein n=2 Tax=Pyramidobacter sp. TaxID=1943581 RepID=UPI002A754EB8
MNKVYQVIWSGARGCRVVVSELVKRNGRNCGSCGSCGVSLRSLLCAATVAGAALALALPAGAVPAAADGKQKEVVLAASDGSVHYFSVKANDSASPDGTNWNNDGATGDSAVAIGRKGHAIGDFSVAMGHDSHAAGKGGISIGRMSDSQDYRYQGALGNDSIAIGTDAIAGVKDHPEISASVALGIRAVSDQTDAVAIGSYSVADREPVADKTSVYMGGDAAVQNTAASTRSAVAVGRTTGGNSSWSERFNRQITGVAAGTENSDAVNVAQLKAVVAMVGTAAGGVHYFSVKANDGASPDSTNWNNDGATGEKAIAIGRSSKAKGSDSIAIGSESQVETNSGVAIGLKSQSGNSGVAIGANSQSGSESVALGNGAKAYGRGAVVLGDGAKADAKVGSSVAIGSSSTADRGGFTSSTIAPFSGVELKDITLGAVSVAGSGKLRQIINLADGTEPTDAVNLRQLRAVSSTVEANTSNITKLQGGFYLKADNTTSNVALGGATPPTVEFAAGKNLTVGLTDKKITYVIVENPEFASVTVKSGTNKIKLNGATGTIAGLSNTTLDAGWGENDRAGQAATEGQLKLVKDDIDNLTPTVNNALQDWKVQIDGADVKTVSKTDNILNFKKGDNILLTNDSGAVRIATSLTPHFTEVTVGAAGASKTYLYDGYATFGGISINDAAGSNTVKGLSNTTLDTGWGTGIRAGQAATEGQLKAATLAAGQNATYTIGADPAGAAPGILLDSAHKRLDIIPTGDVITTAVSGRTLRV